MPRFDCFVIDSLDTLRQKIDYIHANPVRKGLVDDPAHWPYSSAAAYAGSKSPIIPVDTEWQSIGF